MNLINYILTKFFKKLNVPQQAIDMFNAARKISQIEKRAFPKELIPLNSLQYSRGILNFAFIQANPHWIYPFWVNKEFNPEDNSFIPRSHLGLTMNITHRSWTAAGNPECSCEPIVDPRGLVTPFRNRWSIDLWLADGDKIFFPSRSDTCTQHLTENLPIVVTEFLFTNFTLKQTAYTIGSILIYNAEINNSGNSPLNIRMCVSIRPFNPEGCAIIKEITFDRSNNQFKINGTDRFILSSSPDSVVCHSFSDGDVSKLLTNPGSEIKDVLTSSCEIGFANSAAFYNVRLEANETSKLECICPLSRTAQIPDIKSLQPEKAISRWRDILSHGTEIRTPDETLNRLVKASVSALLQFSDKGSITPGPFTYHHFWIRDATYMVLALDRFGYFNIAEMIIKTFFELKEKSGYFRSQKGEWDSNGQVLWIIYQHYLLSNNIKIAEKYFSDLFDGIKWISTMLKTDKISPDKPFYGLLPKGLSAEHLGLADYYYWDNIWSIAGIRAFIALCSLLGKSREQVYAENLLKDYEINFKKSLDYSIQASGLDIIPAAPGREPDCGMIGSVCASYPLQVMDPESKLVVNSIDTIYRKFFREDLFFQEFIHSGYNIYLTLHVAHSYLYAGRRKKFNNIFRSVIDFASPTLNFPEAIHPFTGGGSMGDGHHGWASADLALAAADMFVYEYLSNGEYLLYLLRGISPEWFKMQQEFYVNNAYLSLGHISIKCSFDNSLIIIKVAFEFYREDNFYWILELPFTVSKLILNGNPFSFSVPKEQVTIISGTKSSINGNELNFIIEIIKNQNN